MRESFASEADPVAKREEATSAPAEPNTAGVEATDIERDVGLKPRSPVAVLMASAAVAACGGGGGGEAAAPSAGTPSPVPQPVPPAALDTADMASARLLLHAQIAATDADVVAVRSQGAAIWLDAQMALPIGQTAWDWFVSKDYSAIDANRFYDMDYPIDYGMAYQLVNAADGVRKRVALALSEYFVIASPGLGGMDWKLLGVAHFWDQLNQHAFGNFRALLEAVTLNPAMGIYLNTKGNAKEDAITGRTPDENYAREVMQLFTIGLTRLNADGTPVLDGSGKPIPTFGQDDVTQLARVFTGYDWWDDGQRFPAASDGYPRHYPEFARRAMVFNAAQHSNQSVTFLGSAISANADGATALASALDTLFNHPNVGPFFGRQMIQRLVTSNPSSAYVARVTAKFNDNGSGVRGDLKAVWKAILLDDEAQGAAGLTSTTFGKIREPMIRVYQWARTFNVQSARGTWKWGFDYNNPNVWYDQRPFFSPSVFNFFRPGYIPPGTAIAAAGATAPEFQIVNESTVSQWVNVIESIAFSGMYVVLPDRPELPIPYAGPYTIDGFDINTTYTAEIAIAHDASALVRRLNLLLCAGQLSSDTQSRIVGILTDQSNLEASSSNDAKRSRVGAAVILVMCSPEYIVQK